jgi:DNA-directed RNA polymerase specialized sigma24 family protein
VTLRYLADLPEAEVAEVLGVSPGSVKTHLHRALASMRVSLSTDERGETSVAGT